MVTDLPIQGILERLVQRTLAILPVTATGVTSLCQMQVPGIRSVSRVGNALGPRFEPLNHPRFDGDCCAWI